MIRYLLSIKAISASFGVGALIAFASIPLAAQSSDQNNPTPVTKDEIRGEIKARDVGDSRLTTHYYLFRGTQGDVFINVVTNNIKGAIDVFSKIGLRPRARITLFADSQENETGRVVYMRESALLILRVQGRTPNDDRGNYQLKFAGSFSPVSSLAENDWDPMVRSAEGAVRVNSVGTILTEPAAKQAPNETATALEPEPASGEKKNQEETAGRVSDAAIPGELSKGDLGERRDASTGGRETGIPAGADTGRRKEPESVVRPDEEGVDIAKEVTVEFGGQKGNRSALVTISREPEPDSEATLEERLANVFLRISLKDGGRFTRSMNEVLSVNVIRGVLTVVTTDGRIQEFSILDVLKMTIE